MLGGIYVKFGSQVRYESEALEEWAESRQRRSTSDLGPDEGKGRRGRRV